MEEIEDFEKMQQHVEDEKEYDAGAGFFDEESDPEDIARGKRDRKQVKKRWRVLNDCK